MRCPGDRTGVIKERVLGGARDGSVIERQDRGSQSGRRNSEGFESAAPDSGLAWCEAAVFEHGGRVGSR